MKVTSITRNNYDTSLNQSNVSVQPPRLLSQPAKDSVSFSGLGSGFKNGLSDMFAGMGTNFFVQFLVVDTLSMIIPRVIIGLGRDKDKTGKINIKAGAEEAGREILSGPSMGLIPMGILAAMTHFAPASHMHASTLSAVTDNMKKAIGNISEAGAFESKETLNKKLADELFEDAFGEFKMADATKKGFKTKFANLLDEGSKLKSGMFNNKEYKAKATEFEELVGEIHNANKNKKPLDTKALAFSFENSEKIMDKANVSAKDLFKDFHNYSKDVVEKVSKKGFAQQTLEAGKEEASKLVKDLKGKRAFTKQATVIGAFLAVGIFLVQLPKLYQQKGLSPAQESAKRAQAEAAAAQGGANENK